MRKPIRIEVVGGVASVDSDTIPTGVEVLIYDYDNEKDTPEGETYEPELETSTAKTADELVRTIAAAHWDGEEDEAGEPSDIENDDAHDWIVEIIQAAREVLGVTK